MAPYYGLRGEKLNLALASIAGLGFLLFGYDQGVMGGLLTLPEFISVFPELNTLSTIPSVKSKAATIQGITVALYEIGCFAGALATLYFGERFGRRKMIWYGAWIMTIGAVLQCASFSLAQLIVGRLVSGFGNGFITATCPVWQAECAKPEKRGRLIMIEGALITCGIMISYWLDLAFSFAPGQISWRFPIAFQIIFCIGLLIFVLPLPESPRWLVKRGRIEEATAVFAALDDLKSESPMVIMQVEEVQASLPAVESYGVTDLFTQGKQKNFWRASLAFWAQIMQQISGINLITYYAATIFQTSIGLSPLNSLILAAANGTEYFLASWIAVYTVERFGRRKLMIFGAIGQSFSMAMLSVTVYLATAEDALPHGGQNNSKAGIAAAVFLFVFNTFFAIGWLGSTWLYPPEIVSLRVRTASTGISTAGNWISNFLIVLITPIAFDQIGFYTYAVFAVLNALMAPTVYFLYPETANRTLEEMDDIFENADPKRPWEVVKIAREMPFRSRAAAFDVEGKGGDGIRQRAGKSSSEEKGSAEKGTDKDQTIENASLSDTTDVE